MRHLIIAAFTVINLLSCSNRPSKEGIKRFTNQIAAVADDKAQVHFIHLVNEAIVSAKNNEMVDTNRLRNALFKASEDNQEKIFLLKSVKEIDDEINLKQITLRYYEILDSGFSDGYSKFIQAVNMPLGNDKGQMLGRLIIPVDKMIFNAERDMIEARKMFWKKYLSEQNGDNINNQKQHFS